MIKYLVAASMAADNSILTHKYIFGKRHDRRSQYQEPHKHIYYKLQNTNPDIHIQTLINYKLICREGLE